MLLKTFKGEVEHDGLATIVDLARQLERELDEMNHIAVSRHRQICRITAMWREDIEECDKLKERLAALSNDQAHPTAAKTGVDVINELAKRRGTI